MTPHERDRVKFRVRYTDPEPLQRFVALVNEHAKIPREESFYRIVETEWEVGHPSRFTLELSERTVRVTPFRAWTFSQGMGLHPLTPADVERVEYRNHLYTLEE